MTKDLIRKTSTEISGRTLTEKEAEDILTKFLKEYQKKTRFRKLFVKQFKRKK